MQLLTKKISPYRLKRTLSPDHSGCGRLMNLDDGNPSVFLSGNSLTTEMSLLLIWSD